MRVGSVLHIAVVRLCQKSVERFEIKLFSLRSKDFFFVFLLAYLYFISTLLELGIQTIHQCFHFIWINLMCTFFTIPMKIIVLNSRSIIFKYITILILILLWTVNRWIICFFILKCLIPIPHFAPDEGTNAVKGVWNVGWANWNSFTILMGRQMRNKQDPTVLSIYYRPSSRPTADGTLPTAGNRKKEKELIR